MRENYSLFPADCFCAPTAPCRPTLHPVLLIASSQLYIDRSRIDLEIIAGNKSVPGKTPQQHGTLHLSSSILHIAVRVLVGVSQTCA